MENKSGRRQRVTFACQYSAAGEEEREAQESAVGEKSEGCDNSGAITKDTTLYASHMEQSMTDTETKTTRRDRTSWMVGGQRDPRVRAVQGTEKIEVAVGYIEEELLPTRMGGRLLRIGRLALRYDRSREQFRWRRREGPHQWSEVGRRVPWEIKKRLRAASRAKVDGVEQWLAIRTIGVTALRLIDWCAQTGGEWTEELVTLYWKGALPRGGRWTCMLKGGRLHRGGVMVEDGPPADYQERVEQLLRGRECEGGDVTVRVRKMVATLEELDKRLHQLRAEMKSGVRLYYDRFRDTFQMRQVIDKGWSVYQGKILHEGVRKYLPAVERVRITEAEFTLAERMRLKRALQVIAAVGEAMERWPEGRWQVRAKKAKGVPASWVTQSAEWGLLTRRYDGTAIAGQPSQKDDADNVEWFDE